MTKHIYIHARRYGKTFDAGWVVWLEMPGGKTQRAEMTREQAVSMNEKGANRTAVLRNMAQASGAIGARATRGSEVVDWSS